MEKSLKIDQKINNAILRRNLHLKDIKKDIELLNSQKDKIQEMFICTRFIDEDGDVSISTRYIGNHYVCLGMLKAMERRLLEDLDTHEYGFDGNPLDGSNVSDY